ncbi:MAG: hypothetical protein KIG32_06530 [Ruminiclostridium sp.]|nr:hypothetical protein [Ruminiclostridium sp.]
MNSIQTITALERLTADANSTEKLLRSFKIFVDNECPVKGECENFSAHAVVFADRMDAFREVLFKAYELASDVYKQADDLLTQIENERSETE